jgi:flagellar biogenesis protein FliO
MRAGPMILILASLLVAPMAHAQTTQPAAAAQPPQQLIRRDAVTGVTGATAANPSGPSAARVALSLGAVLTLILGLFLAGRRFLPRSAFRQNGGGGAVQVLARTPITPKQRIVLVQVGRRILVVADAGPNLTTLCEITDADEAAALIAQLQSERGGGSFSAALNNAMERFRSAQAPRNDAPAREPRLDLDSMRQELEGLARRVRGMAR